MYPPGLVQGSQIYLSIELLEDGISVSSSNNSHVGPDYLQKAVIPSSVMEYVTGIISEWNWKEL